MRFPTAPSIRPHLERFAATRSRVPAAALIVIVVLGTTFVAASASIAPSGSTPSAAGLIRGSIASLDDAATTTTIPSTTIAPTTVAPTTLPPTTLPPTTLPPTTVPPTTLPPTTAPPTTSAPPAPPEPAPAPVERVEIPPPPPPAKPAATPASPGAASAFLGSINALRAGTGASPLQNSGALTAVAQGWADHMASTKTLAHNPATGSQIPGGWTTWAENVGYGGSAGQIQAALEASPGHYRNMVNPDLQQVGIGVAVDSDGLLWTAHVFARY